MTTEVVDAIGTIDAIETVEERVARGAALLDERNPGWATRIVVRRLLMRSRGRCVLGQLYGDSSDGGDSLFPEFAHDSLMDSRPMEWFNCVESHGFFAFLPRNVTAEYAALHIAWIEEIDQRLAVAGEGGGA